MATHYILDESGFIIGIVDGAGTSQRSTTIPPNWEENPVPQFVNGAWVPPAAIGPPDMRITRLSFMQRFTSQERITIRITASSDPQVQDVWALMDAATFIDLARIETQQGVGLLAFKNQISQSRVTEILTADIQPTERYAG
jgi:hypothetical protein